jgi:hypothetical protein
MPRRIRCLSKLRARRRAAILRAAAAEAAAEHAKAIGRIIALSRSDR